MFLKKDPDFSEAGTSQDRDIMCCFIFRYEFSEGIQPNTASIWSSTLPETNSSPLKVKILEAKNHPIEKENHLNQTSMTLGFKMLIFPWCNILGGIVAKWCPVIRAVVSRHFFCQDYSMGPLTFLNVIISCKISQVIIRYHEMS